MGGGGALRHGAPPLFSKLKKSALSDFNNLIISNFVAMLSIHLLH